MKYILFLLICISSLANADVVATSEMLNGYRLFLFNTKGKCQNGYDALLAGSKSRPLAGCWMYEKNKIYLQYDDGDFRIYPIEGFDVRQSSTTDEQNVEL